MRNFFYMLVIFLWISCFYRFHYQHGQYPWNDYETGEWTIVSLFLIVMATWSHYHVGWGHNPGIVEWHHFRTKEQLEGEQNKKDQVLWNTIRSKDKEYVMKRQEYHSEVQCMKCGAQKVDLVHHCSQCNRCVYKMDHHCPWTDNCIAYYNVKAFILFLFWTGCLCQFTSMYNRTKAYRNKMRHINLFNLAVGVPPNVRKDLIPKYFIPAEWVEHYNKEYETFYNRTESYRNLPVNYQDKEYLLQSINIWIDGMSYSEYDIWYAPSHFGDWCIFLMTAACGLYTAGLAI